MWRALAAQHVLHHILFLQFHHYHQAIHNHHDLFDIPHDLFVRQYSVWKHPPLIEVSRWVAVVGLLQRSDTSNTLSWPLRSGIHDLRDLSSPVRVAQLRLRRCGVWRAVFLRKLHRLPRSSGCVQSVQHGMLGRLHDNVRRGLSPDDVLVYHTIEHDDESIFHNFLLLYDFVVVGQRSYGVDFSRVLHRLGHPRALWIQLYGLCHDQRHMSSQMRHPWVQVCRNRILHRMLLRKLDRILGCLYRIVSMLDDMWRRLWQYVWSGLYADDVAE